MYPSCLYLPMKPDLGPAPDVGKSGKSAAGLTSDFALLAGDLSSGLRVYTFLRACVVVEVPSWGSFDLLGEDTDGET